MRAPTDLESCQERLERVTRLTQRGESAQRIAWRLGISVITVEKYRRRAREGWVPHAGRADRGRRAETIQRDPRGRFVPLP